MKKISKDTIHVIIAIALLLLLRFCIPVSHGLTKAGLNAIAILIPTLYLWVTVTTGWTTMAALAGLILTGVVTSANAWNGVMGSSVAIILIVCIPLNNILQQTGVTKAIVTWFITRKFVQNRPYVFLSMFFASCFLIGLVFSSLTLCIIFLPLAQQICDDLGYKKGDSFYKVLTLGILWISSFINGATPIAHSVPVMLMTAYEASTGVAISFSKWMSIGIPCSLVLLIIFLLVVKFIWKPDTSKYVNYDIEKIKAEYKPIGLDGKIAALLFILVIIAWIFPDLGKGFAPETAAFLKKIGTSVAPLFALGLLCVIRINGAPIANFKKAYAAIPLSTLVFAGFITLFGTITSDKAVGISVFLQNITAPVTQNLSPLALIAVTLFLAYIMTSFISNTVTMLLFYSVAVPVLLTLSSVNMTAFVVLLCVVSNLGAATPSASPNCGLFYGQYFELKEVAKYNITYILISFVGIMLIAYPLANLLA